ncbi:MAG TPA: LytTR family transcriptional regulator DNA-binding domain-containing protein [Ferruginibacter sp.]|jgi:two-component system LytT family response regulator|nr:LytTR family transcriptional regulator DNA-binding domain-containing protein [Ferruginibacter sp.]
MKAIIIDDEPLARMIVKEYLQSYKEIEIVAECGDGFEGLKAIQQYQPDIVFLDIQMPKITGFEMLELVDQPVSIVFTTAYDQYAIKAFEANAVDYLLKPFGKERFDKAMQKFLEQQNSNNRKYLSQQLLQTAASSPIQNNRVVVKNGNKIKIIPAIDILYLEAADDYVKIHTKEGSFLKNKTMSYFEETLDTGLFVRCHRSYIINVQEVTRIDQNEKDSHIALLKSGIKIPVSRNGYTKLKIVLGL